MCHRLSCECISVRVYNPSPFSCSTQSLKSTGYVKEQFAWRHFYWYLTNEGIQYLRDFLHLPPEIVPATLRRQIRPETARPRPKGMQSTPRTATFFKQESFSSQVKSRKTAAMATFIQAIVLL